MAEKRLIDISPYEIGGHASLLYVSEEGSLFQTLTSGIPTIDAVNVVRCRKCKHWKPTGSKAGNLFSDMEYIGGCEFTNYCRRESDFCSYGERKDGDD